VHPLDTELRGSERWRTIGVGTEVYPFGLGVVHTSGCTQLAPGVWVCPDGVSVRVVRRDYTADVVLRDEALSRDVVLQTRAPREVSLFVRRSAPRGEAFVSAYTAEPQGYWPPRRIALLGAFRYLPGSGAPVAEDVAVFRSVPLSAEILSSAAGIVAIERRDDTGELARVSALRAGEPPRVLWPLSR
jgi:hypothetical protein